MKFERVPKEFIIENAKDLKTLPYYKIQTEEGFKHWIENPDTGWWFEYLPSYLPYEAIESEFGKDSEGSGWMWAYKTNPDRIYLLEYSPKHPLELKLEEIKITPDRSNLYYTYNVDFVEVKGNRVLFPVVQVVEERSESELNQYRNTGMLFTSAIQLGEHFEKYSRELLKHPWYASGIDLNPQ